MAKGPARGVIFIIESDLIGWYGLGAARAEEARAKARIEVNIS